MDHERMYDRGETSTDEEKAATLCLMDRRLAPWNRLAVAIEEAGGALSLLEEIERGSEDRLFYDDSITRSLGQYVDQVNEFRSEGIDLLTVLDSKYPSNLRLVHDRPPALFVKGSLGPEDTRSVAVVGSRKASAEGLAQAAEIAGGLTSAEYVVVSGLAAGIDTAAHRGCLAAGGRTIAVIGTGHRQYFPKENAELQDLISNSSAVVSQFLPDQGPRKWTFPQRNAVMSGFARATVVVEAGNTSGARMQARLAIEHGKPVFLMRSLLRHEWARMFADDRPSTYVVDSGKEVVDHLERLYADDLALTAV